MQHPIGEHALLADSRTAALIAPDGDIAWLCWPRIDSTPLLFSILDDERGGRLGRGKGHGARRHWTEEAVLVAFGVVMLALAVYGLRQRD